jgi:hypothetical protein
MGPNDCRTLRDAASPCKEPVITVYCRLFYDVVPVHVCVMRKKELSTFGWKTCSGCAVGLLQYWTDQQQDH